MSKLVTQIDALINRPTYLGQVGQGLSQTEIIDLKTAVPDTENTLGQGLGQGLSQTAELEGAVVGHAVSQNSKTEGNFGELGQMGQGLSQTPKSGQQICEDYLRAHPEMVDTPDRKLAETVLIEGNTYGYKTWQRAKKKVTEE